MDKAITLSEVLRGYLGAMGEDWITLSAWVAKLPQPRSAQSARPAALRLVNLGLAEFSAPFSFNRKSGDAGKYRITAAGKEVLAQQLGVGGRPKDAAASPTDLTARLQAAMGVGWCTAADLASALELSVSRVAGALRVLCEAGKVRQRPARNEFSTVINEWAFGPEPVSEPDDPPVIDPTRPAPPVHRSSQDLRAAELAGMPPAESYAMAQPRRITTPGVRGGLSLRTLSQIARVGGDGRARRFG